MYSGRGAAALERALQAAGDGLGENGGVDYGEQCTAATGFPLADQNVGFRQPLEPIVSFCLSHPAP